MTCQGNILDQGVILQVVKNISTFQVDRENNNAVYYLLLGAIGPVLYVEG